MTELNPLLRACLTRLAVAPLPPAELLPFIHPPEPGQTGRLIITGARGCGKTTALRARAASAAREILDCAAGPLADILLPPAETPVYLDMRRWQGSLIELTAAALAPDSGETGQAAAQDILSGPALLLLDHVESLPIECAPTLGEQLAQWTSPERTTIWAGWRNLPGHPTPAWLTGWQQIVLNDWDDTQVLLAIKALFRPEAASQAVHQLAGDSQVWRATHRPLFLALVRAGLDGGSRWPLRAELSLKILGALLGLDQNDAVQDWLDHAGFGACRLAWFMLEQDTDALPLEEAERVMQDAPSAGGATLDALLEAGVMTLNGGLVAFDQPLTANLCAAWYARARPDRFGGGAQAEIGQSGRARALHHALDMAGDAIALLRSALDIAAPIEIFQAASGWLASIPPERARQALEALAQHLAPEAMLILAHTLSRAEAQTLRPAFRLAAYAAELARTALRAAHNPARLPGPAAPNSWAALYRSGENLFRSTLEQAAGRSEEALHSAQAALAASAGAAAWAAHELGLLLLEQGETNSALQVFELAITFQPEEAAHHWQAGRAWLQACNPSQALEHLEQALRLSPHNQRISLTLVEACIHAGHIENARRCVERIQPLPNDPDAWRQLGQIWAALDESDLAIQAWQHSVKLAPRQAAWQIELAQALLERGQTSAALAACQRALAFAPDDPAAHRALGQACLHCGHASEAASHLSRALEAQPDEPELLLLYAEAASLAGQERQAISAFERVLNLRPGDLRAAVGLARLYAERDRPSDAHAVLDWVLRRQPDYTDGLVVKALLAEKRNDAQAIQFYDQALEKSNSDIESRYNERETRLRRARLYWRSGRVEAARQELGRLGEWPPALRALARLELARQRPQSALDSLRPIDAREWDAETLRLWGQARLDSGSPDQAWKIFAQAARAHADDPATLEGLGGALEKLGQDHQAASVYRRALELAPAQPSAYCALGRLYRRAGQIEVSAAVLAEAVRVLPDDAQCHAELGQSLAELATPAWREAEQQFARAAALAPNVAAYWRWHGCALRHLGQLDAAGRALARARELGGDAAAQIETAWLYRDLGDAPRALEALEEAAHTDDTDTLLQIARAFRELDRPQRAEELLLAALPEAASQADLQLELGQARLAQNRVEAALASFEQAAALAPERGECYAAIAAALTRLGQWDAAAQQWERARALGYATAESLRQHGQTLQTLQRHAEALAIYERLIELRPRDAQAYLAAACAARELDLAERAVELAGWAAAIEPGLTPAYVLIGQVCMEHGQSERALAALKRASDLSPNDRPVWLGLARAALNTGQAETALQAARSLLARDDNDADACLIMGTAHLTRAAARFDDREQEWRQAIRSFAAALDRRPGDVDAALGLARALAALGLDNEAREREGALSPGSPLLTQAEWDAGLTALQSAGELSRLERIALRALLSSLRGDRVQAAQQLKPLLSSLDLPAHALRYMAATLRRAGAPRLGLSAIRRAAQLNRRDASMLYELGATLEELDRHEGSASRRAGAAYQRAAALEPANSLYAHAAARARLHWGEADMARQALESAIALSPDIAAWRAELGQLCADQGDLPAAAQALEEACRLNESPAWRRQLGQVYAQMGQYAAAVIEMEAAIRCAPGQVEWWVELGDLHRQAGAGARALLCYKQALARSPDDGDLALMISELASELGRWQEALDIVTSALRRDPAQARLQAQAGKLYERLGQFERALEAYTLAARLSPQTAVYPAQAGRLALQLEQPETAIHYLEQAIAADRGQRQAYGWLGKAYQALGRQDEALQVYQHAATLEPDNVTHHLNLGKLYRQRGDERQAIAHLEVAHSLEQDNAAVLEEMLALHQSRREYRRALTLCLQLISLRSNADDYYCAGMLYKQLKAYPEALDMFKRATRLAPQHSQAYKQIAVVSAMGFFK